MSLDAGKLEQKKEIPMWKCYEGHVFPACLKWLDCLGRKAFSISPPVIAVGFYAFYQLEEDTFRS